MRRFEVPHDRVPARTTGDGVAADRPGIASIQGMTVVFWVVLDV
jgi:hypothetical protein